MKQGVVKYILFLLAYSPLYVIAALRTINGKVKTDGGIDLTLKEILNNNIVPILLIIFTIILIAYFLIYSRLALNPKGNPVFKIKSIKLQHKEYITYLGTYILPFVALKAETVFDVFAFVFMFLTIGFIFSKTNLIYTNPTLAFFGFDIYEVETTDGKIYDCISKEKLIVGDKTRGIKLGENTFIISKWKKKN